MKHYVAEIKCGLFPDRKEDFPFGFALVKIVNQLFAGSSSKAPQVRTKRAYVCYAGDKDPKLLLLLLMTT